MLSRVTDVRSCVIGRRQNAYDQVSNWASRNPLFKPSPKLVVQPSLLVEPPFWPGLRGFLSDRELDAMADKWRKLG